MSKQKAHRVECPCCGQMTLTYLRLGTERLKGHCKPGTDPKRSIGCDCPGSYRPVLVEHGPSFDSASAEVRND